MLAVQVVRAPLSSVVVYRLVLVVPGVKLTSVLASEIGTGAELTSLVSAVTVVVVVAPFSSVVA